MVLGGGGNGGRLAVTPRGGEDMAAAADDAARRAAAHVVTVVVRRLDKPHSSQFTQWIFSARSSEESWGKQVENPSNGTLK